MLNFCVKNQEKEWIFTAYDGHEFYIKSLILNYFRYGKRVEFFNKLIK